MDRVEVRMRCLESAKERPFSSEQQVLEAAEKYFEWVTAAPKLQQPARKKPDK